MIEIINKLLLLHVVGCLHYCINDARSHKHHMQLHIFTHDPPKHTFRYGLKI